MKKRIAVYAGSFDPITNGHMDVVLRAAKLYDELIVMVAVNSEKTPTFSTEKRVELAKAVTRHIENIRVVACVDRYVVKVAEELGATVVVRGLRNFADLEKEQGIAAENHGICPRIETVFISCRPEFAHVSSSVVRAHRGADPGWLKEAARSVPAAVAVALKEDWILKKAQAHWQKLMLSLGNPEKGNAIFADLVARYAEPHRAYHTLEHIVKMLDELEKSGGGTENATDVIMATWFHDAVYDPTAKDNEEKSVMVAEEAMKHFGSPLGSLGFCVFNRREVVECIMATKKSVCSLDFFSTRLLVDLDLAILGASEEEFDEYEAGIRKEYEHVLPRDFAIGRSRILRSFLDRPRIYATEHFCQKHEAAARANLARSIENLRFGCLSELESQTYNA